MINESFHEFMRYTSARRDFRRNQFVRANRINSNKAKNGFTVIELLVVIIIMLAFMGVVWFAVKPIELAKRAKDQARLVDLYNLNQAIQESVQSSSVPIAETLCVGGIQNGFCLGQSNQGGSENKAVDGTGWVKVSVVGAKQLSSLPQDPVNNETYFYAYKSDGKNWELNTKLESDQYINELKKMSTDDGNNDNVFEIGTDLNLLP